MSDELVILMDALHQHSAPDHSDENVACDAVNAIEGDVRVCDVGHSTLKRNAVSDEG